MPLPEPFFVIATQNPQEQVGTFPLPESQLDRFLMRVHLGYPAAAAERELLRGVDRRELVDSLSPRARRRRACALCSGAVLGRSCGAARCSTTCRRWSPTPAAPPALRSGFRRAPRSACCARRAPGRCIAGRDAVMPEHVQAVFAAVVEHRLGQRDAGAVGAQRLLEAVPIP